MARSSAVILPDDCSDAYTVYRAIGTMDQGKAAIRCRVCGAAVPVGNASDHHCAHSTKLLLQCAVAGIAVSYGYVPGYKKVLGVFTKAVEAYDSLLTRLSFITPAVVPLAAKLSGSTLPDLYAARYWSVLLGEIHSARFAYSFIDDVFVEVVGVPMWFCAYSLVPEGTVERVAKVFADKYVGHRSRLTEILRSTAGYLTSMTSSDFLKLHNSATIRIVPGTSGRLNALEVSIPGGPTCTDRDPHLVQSDFAGAEPVNNYLRVVPGKEGMCRLMLLTLPYTQSYDELCYMIVYTETPFNLRQPQQEFVIGSIESIDVARQIFDQLSSGEADPWQYPHLYKPATRPFDRAHLKVLELKLD